MFLFLLSEVVEFHGYTISYSEPNESCFLTFNCNRQRTNRRRRRRRRCEDRLQEVRRPSRSRGYWDRRVCASGSVRRRSGRPLCSAAVRPPQDDEEERLLRRETAPTSSHRLERTSSQGASLHSTQWKTNTVASVVYSDSRYWQAWILDDRQCCSHMQLAYVGVPHQSPQF